MPNEQVHPHALRSATHLTRGALANPGTSARSRANSIGAFARRALARVTCQLRLWRRRRRESAELGLLSARELRDLGIDRYEADNEARKVFWRQ